MHTCHDGDTISALHITIVIFIISFSSHETIAIIVIIVIIVQG